MNHHGLSLILYITNSKNVELNMNQINFLIRHIAQFATHKNILKVSRKSCRNSISLKMQSVLNIFPFIHSTKQDLLKNCMIIKKIIYNQKIQPTFKSVASLRIFSRLI